MTTHTSIPAASVVPADAAAQAGSRPAGRQTPARVPLTRLVRVELRKSFDTRSGRWLLASLGLAAVLTTGAIIAWAPTSELAYSEFTLAIGVPMTIILPIIAALSVTSEWSQRSGLTTFTLVPHRGRVVLAKAVAAVLVTVPASPGFVHVLRTVVASVAARLDLAIDGVEEMRIAIDEAASLLLHLPVPATRLRAEITADPAGLTIRLSSDAAVAEWPPSGTEETWPWRVISGLCDEAGFDASTTGPQVWMRRRRPDARS